MISEIMEILFSVILTVAGLVGLMTLLNYVAKPFFNTEKKIHWGEVLVRAFFIMLILYNLVLYLIVCIDVIFK